MLKRGIGYWVLGIDRYQLSGVEKWVGLLLVQRWRDIRILGY